MDEFRQNNRLRGALDAALSGLNGDPLPSLSVFRCAEENQGRRRSCPSVLYLPLSRCWRPQALPRRRSICLAPGQNDRRFAEIAPQTAISAGIFRRSNRKNRHCRRVHHQRLLRRRIAAHRLLNSRAFQALSLFRRRMNSWRGCARPTLSLRG